jgi:hypothetical protein
VLQRLAFELLCCSAAGICAALSFRRWHSRCAARALLAFGLHCPPAAGIRTALCVRRCLWHWASATRLLLAFALCCALDAGIRPAPPSRGWHSSGAARRWLALALQSAASAGANFSSADALTGQRCAAHPAARLGMLLLTCVVLPNRVLAAPSRFALLLRLELSQFSPVSSRTTFLRSLMRSHGGVNGSATPSRCFPCRGCGPALAD